jgi:hypothetical protein
MQKPDQFSVQINTQQRFRVNRVAGQYARNGILRGLE